MQSFVDNASRQSVIQGARLIKANYLNHFFIVDQNNPLVTNSKKAIKYHFESGRQHRPLALNDANSYIASSVLLHNIDGWNYLAHSIESLLSGDHNIAMHLAYYAELRSSMSFLASEGIGIFNHDHLNINQHNVIGKNPVMRNRGFVIPSGTHQFVWDCIEAWVNSNVKPNHGDLLRIFSVYNKNFGEWIAAFPFTGSGAVGHAIVKQWLNDWNSDVRLFRRDREARNFSSYVPQRMENLNHYSVNEVIDKLNSFWEIVEPNSLNKFQLLDQYLLRILLQKIYKALPTSVKNVLTLEEAIRDTLSALKLNHDTSLIRFLADTSTISHPIFVEAKRPAIDTVSKTINSLSVIARATLMLRISTGNASYIFSSASISKEELNFLWDTIGIENGFWEAGKQPVNFNTLWDEVKDHIEDVQDWALSESPTLSLSNIISTGEIAQAFNYFKQFHRAGLWGISL